MSIHRARFATALAAAISTPLVAQEYFGKWEDAATPTTKYYVSTLGQDTNPGTSPAQPFLTIRHALAAAGTPVAGNPVTINVAPGIYTDGTNSQGAQLELFPLRVPQRGVRIEAYAANTGEVVIRPQAPTPPSQLMIVGTLSGPQSPGLPDSELRGLRFDMGYGWNGLVLSAPSVVGTPSSVLVAQCKFTANGGLGARALTVDSLGPGLTEHRILQNRFTASEVTFVAIQDSRSSCSDSGNLYRGNDVSGYVYGIACLGNAQPERYHPRLQSNFVQMCENLVLLDSSNAVMSNNTLAYARVLVAPSVAIGLNVNGGAPLCVNNCIWNPTATNTFGVYLAPVNGNYDGTTTPFTPPNFVGWSGPGYPTSTAPIDLHLNPALTSPLLGRGNALLVAPGNTDSFSGYTLRTDVPEDGDGEPRSRWDSAAGKQSVDVGADQWQANGVRLAPVACPNPTTCLDGFGNLLELAVGSRTYATQVQITGAPNATFALYLAFAFYDTLSGIENGPTYQHAQFPAIPSHQIGISTSESYVVTSGTLSALGTATVTVPLPLGAWPNNSCSEAEIYLQAFLQEPGRVAPTGRLRIELNQ